MDRLLSACYTNSLQIAADHNLSTIAFPNISTGIYRFPKLRAAQLAVDTVTNFLRHDTSIKMVSFICFDQINFQIYSDILFDT